MTNATITQPMDAMFTSHYWGTRSNVPTRYERFAEEHPEFIAVSP